MTSFCTKCGKQLGEGAAFCTNCGARAEVQGAIPVQPAPARAATPPASVLQNNVAQAPEPSPPVTSAGAVPAPGANQESGSPIVKIIVVVLGFFAVVAVLVIGSCVYIGYRVKKKAEQVQQAYKKEDIGKALGALGQGGSQGAAQGGGQGQPEGAPDLAKILGALGQNMGAASNTGETLLESPCPDVDPTVSKKFRDAAASASIPLVAGLTLTSVFTNQQLGGRDIESLETVQGIDANTVTIQGAQAVKNGLSGQRHLCIADLQGAYQYDTGFSSDIPQTILGTTMFSMSSATFEDLKAGRPALLDYFETQNTGEGRYRHAEEYGKGQLSRVEAQDVPYSVIVNGARKDLPAIHVKGKLGSHDTEAFVLDDPANAITLSLRMPHYNFFLNYLKITFPVEKGIQQQIAKGGCAAVYGIYFDFNSATVRPESGPSLNEVAEAIKNNPDWKLKIEGHTDNVGGDAYNLDLSNRRAAAVKHTLEAQYQIASSRVTSQGFGASRPKAPNDTPEGRALNRRVEVCRE